MQPINLDGMAQYVGPGTGGLFMGEQQRNAMQESQLGQQKTLQDIATAKQNAEFAAQKNPLELERMRGENAMFPGKLEQQGLETEEKKSKLNKAKYAEYNQEVIDFASSGERSPMEISAYTQAAAKRHGLDPNDERVTMVAGVASKGPQALQQWQEVINKMRPESIEARKKAEETKAQYEAEIKGRGQVAAGNNAATLEAARINASSREQVAALKQAATAKLASVDQRIVQLTAIINDPKTPPEIKAQAQQEGATLVQAKQAIQTAIVTEKADQLAAILGQPGMAGGGGTFPNPFQGGGAPQQPPQMPPQGAPQPGAQAPKPMTPQDQQALQWAMANPQDPRAKAIRQKLGQ